MSKLKLIEKWNTSNLPTWSECERVIGNYEYNKKWGITTVIDEQPIPTALHYFIYENESASKAQDEIFKIGLINVLNEVSKLGEWRDMVFNPEL